MVTGGDDCKINLWRIGKPTSIMVLLWLLKMKSYFFRALPLTVLLSVLFHLIIKNNMSYRAQRAVP